MSYETGTATDPVDLMDKLALFVTANAGMAVDEQKNDGSRDILSINIGTGFFSIGYNPSDNDLMLVLMATGFNVSTAWGAQPNSTPIDNKACTTTFVPNTAIAAYHFFHFSGGVLYVAFLTSEGNWRFLTMGEIVKYGTYTGSPIIWSSFWDPAVSVVDVPSADAHNQFPYGSSGPSVTESSYVWCDHNGTDKFYRLFALEPIATQGMAMFQPNLTGFGWPIICSPSGSTQATVLGVQRVNIAEGVTLNKTIPIGEMPDMRVFNMRFFNAEAIFDTDWKVFPIMVKRDPDIRDEEPNSGFFGVALRFQ